MIAPVSSLIGTDKASQETTGQTEQNQPGTPGSKITTKVSSGKMTGKSGTTGKSGHPENSVKPGTCRVIARPIWTHVKVHWVEIAPGSLLSKRLKGIMALPIRLRSIKVLGKMIVPVRSDTRTGKTTKGRLTQPGTPGSKLTTEVSSDRISFTGHSNETGLYQDRFYRVQNIAGFTELMTGKSGRPEKTGRANTGIKIIRVHQFSGQPMTGFAGCKHNRWRHRWPGFPVRFLWV